MDKEEGFSFPKITATPASERFLGVWMHYEYARVCQMDPGTSGKGIMSRRGRVPNIISYAKLGGGCLREMSTQSQPPTWPTTAPRHVGGCHPSMSNLHSEPWPGLVISEIYGHHICACLAQEPRNPRNEIKTRSRSIAFPFCNPIVYLVYTWE